MKGRHCYFAIKKLAANLKIAGRKIWPQQAIPNHIFLIGAQKAGTSSLHNYICQHPSIISGVNKELAFFSREKIYRRGLRYYRRMYPPLFPGTYALDSTPEYLYYSGVAKRLYDYRPDSKIVVLLREPVSRAFSAFNHYSQAVRTAGFRSRIKQANEDAYSFFMPLIEGNKELTIEHFINCELAAIESNPSIEEPSLIRRGIYAPQLDRYFKLFGRENVLVLFSSELSNDPEGVTNRVFRFVGLSPIFGRAYPRKHVRDYSVDSVVKDLIRQKAGDFFEKDRFDLKDRYGIEVPW